MQQLLISDANVLIDFEDGGLIEAFFSLPYQFAVPDILFEEELQDLHGHLLEMGLQTKVVSGKGMEDVAQLMQKYPGPSTNDCLALALAKEQACPLITGDRRLRRATEQEKVTLYGTVWVLERMLEHRVIDVSQAEQAIEHMRQAGSRLPWKDLYAAVGRFS